MDDGVSGESSYRVEPPCGAPSREPRAHLHTCACTRRETCTYRSMAFLVYFFLSDVVAKLYLLFYIYQR